MKDIILKFIEDNKLNLNESGSGLNSTYTILCGFALYNKVSLKDLIEILDSKFVNVAILSQVYQAALKLNYGKFWTLEKAKKQYIF